jgi:hypothetical protein
MTTSGSMKHLNLVSIKPATAQISIGAGLNYLEGVIL